ncbi:LysR family transcriptional regulator ArgP [Aliamphritea hakodatensis]|uniref:LysR family transcriptional regulator ArgP n=1 Tax=Aliamphritea hakodatensis TaxID=2895352 RepID=UPI0022FD8F75|nr:LysR family transcriptional regulator ArgP [Aliamphritea hakodatensis]
MIDNKGLSAFVAVIQQRNFEKAAQQLFITQSAVSQRLKLLEEQLGQTLLIRTPEIAPTRAGQALLKYAQNLQQLEHALQHELEPRREQSWVQLSIGTNADTLATWLPRALAPWCQQHKVLLQLHVDDQDQTHHLLHSGEVMGCISSLDKPANGCVSTPMGSIEYHCVASPDFHRHYFSGDISAEQFKKAPVVCFNPKDALQHQYLKTYFQLDADQLSRHQVPSSEGFLEWIRLGMGWGMAPKAQVKQLLLNGELTELTPGKTVTVPLYWHQWRVSSGLTDALRTHILAYTGG